MFEKGSPWHRVGEHAPPFFVIHGAMDTLALVDEARAFVERLRRTSREPVAYAELPRAQHAFDQFLSIRTIYTVRAIARFGDWAFKRWMRYARRSSRATTRPSCSKSHVVDVTPVARSRCFCTRIVAVFGSASTIST